MAVDWRVSYSIEPQGYFPAEPPLGPELEQPALERGRQLRPASLPGRPGGVELGEGAMQCWAAAQLARRRPAGVLKAQRTVRFGVPSASGRRGRQRKISTAIQ